MIFLKRLIYLGLMTFAISSFAANSQISDDVITTKILSKIALNPTISVFDVGISTKQGTVTFTGSVNANSEAATLVQIAQSTRGVKDIDTSKLMINKSEQPIKDTMITAKVKGLFIREKLFGDKTLSAANINVETNNGIVYLSGTVENKMQAIKAITLAKSTSGIKKVESKINVVG